jgi:hypothetical protein
MKEHKTEWMSTQMNEWVHKWMNEYTNEWTTTQMNEWMHKLIHERVIINERKINEANWCGGSIWTNVWKRDDKSTKLEQGPSENNERAQVREK